MPKKNKKRKGEYTFISYQEREPLFSRGFKDKFMLMIGGGDYAAKRS